jgi:DNA invertase Pin-like site-specific DNA recombinase
MNRTTCAIYTRKSHAEGLEQEFNSLDAQREACEAFIKSQQHEGWVCNQTAYDDGAYSGGNLDRPALKALLADIEAGKIQIIVVYKVDRLTRSLVDFAKLIELFDQHDVSFVSITQQFNTTSSMGRLTLNVLLSFAQYEREITGERIRDKFKASAQKGMWMGGYTPMGYDAKDRKLHVNPKDTKAIQLIYTKYLELGNVRKLKDYLDQHNVVSKRRVTNDGKTSGGIPFSRGGLYKILSNPIYIGQIKHKENIYPGQHEAIIDGKTWKKVQTLLQRNNNAAKHGLRVKHPSLLAGLLFDDKDNPMSPSHAVKNKKRYRYYTSQALIQNKKEKLGSITRIPAGEIETIVLNKVKAFFNNDNKLMQHLSLDTIKALPTIEECKDISVNLDSHPDQLRKLITKVKVSENNILIKLSMKEILQTLCLEATQGLQEINLKEKVKLRQCGREKKLIISESVVTTPELNPSLVKAISRAYVWNQMLLNREVKSVNQLSRIERISCRYIRHILPLSALSPKVIDTILEGKQHPKTTLNNLLQLVLLPWPDQSVL